MTPFTEEEKFWINKEIERRDDMESFVKYISKPIAKKRQKKYNKGYTYMDFVKGKSILKGRICEMGLLFKDEPIKVFLESVYRDFHNRT